MRDYFATNLSFFLNGQELELAQALLLGDRAGLDKDVTEAFGRTGAMHILAVSGLHIGILMQILMFGFSFFPRLISKKKALILVMIIAWFYALLSGFSASVIRSVVMFSMLILGNLLSKKVHSINILAFSAFVMLCWNPYFLFDLGFQLSYAAMLGIFLFYPFLKQQFYSRFKIIRMVYEGTAIGITAQVFTLPLTLYYFHQFPNYFWLTNIALMAFSFVVLALGVILFILFFSVFLQNIIGYVLEKVMTLMLWIVDSIDKLPLAVAYGFELTKIQVLGLYLLILLFYYVLLKRNVFCLKVVLSVCLVMTGVLVLKRSENINDSFVMFFGGNIPFVVVRENEHNVFVVKSKSGFSNKYIVLSKGFEKIFPGNNKYLNMFNRQNACLEINGKTFLVKSIQGGFEINDTQAMYKILHENDADSTDKSTLHYPLKSPIYLDNNIMIKK
jgi:competence protein ComEC